jgi:hypothetical protein
MVAGATIDASPTVIMWQNGAEKVRYSGALTGTWRGKVTCYQYAFSPTKPTSYVDKRDVEALLAWRDADGKPMFEVI